MANTRKMLAINSDSVFYVYCLFRPWNGEPCYIGKGQGRRWKDHQEEGERHRNPHLRSIFKKAGGPIPAVIIHDGLSEETALAYEVALIAAIGRKKAGGPLVNATDGGDGTSGHEVGPRARKLLGENSKERWADPAQRAQIIAAQNAGKQGPEFTARRSAASRAIWTPEMKARRAAKMAVYLEDPEYRRRISESLKGRGPPPEHMERLRQINLGNKYKLGHKMSDEEKSRRSIAAKKSNRYTVRAKED